MVSAPYLLFGGWECAPPNEIDQEKYVLKMLRGDFDQVAAAAAAASEPETHSLLEAVRA